MDRSGGFAADSVLPRRLLGTTPGQTGMTPSIDRFAMSVSIPVPLKAFQNVKALSVAMLGSELGRRAGSNAGAA